MRSGRWICSAGRLLAELENRGRAATPGGDLCWTAGYRASHPDRRDKLYDPDAGASILQTLALIPRRIGNSAGAAGDDHRDMALLSQSAPTEGRPAVLMGAGPLRSVPRRSWHIDMAKRRPRTRDDMGSRRATSQPVVHAGRRRSDDPRYPRVHGVVLLGIPRQSWARWISLMPGGRQLGWFVAIWAMSVTALAGVGAIIRLVL